MVIMFLLLGATTNVHSSCSTSTILASVLTAIATALLATVVFVLVALCKYRPKGTPGGAESAPSAGGEGQAVYEQVDSVGAVAVNDPTYTEVQPGRKDSFALKIMLFLNFWKSTDTHIFMKYS